MEQRQFRGDDTSLWQGKYGKGTLGPTNFAGTTNSNPIRSVVGGTLGDNHLNANAAFAPGDLLYIEQTQGVGATDAINWELNTVLSYNGSTHIVTLTQPLTRTYTNPGAQCLVIDEYSSIDSTASAVLNGSQWDGATGGIIVLFAQQYADLRNLTINLNNCGFRGGVGIPSHTGQLVGNQGESEIGVGTRSTNSNGRAAGGSAYQFGNGASAGNAGFVVGGDAGAPAHQGTPGQGGNVLADASCRLFLMGAGGGSPGTKDNSGVFAPDGARASGKLLVVSRIIKTGVVHTDGSNGNDGAGNLAPGSGASSGGSQLYKGQKVYLNPGLTALHAQEGKNMDEVTINHFSSQGIIHTDYSQLIDIAQLGGDSNPVSDKRQDPVFNDTSAAFFFL